MRLARGTFQVQLRGSYSCVLAQITPAFPGQSIITISPVEYRSAGEINSGRSINPWPYPWLFAAHCLGGLLLIKQMCSPGCSQGDTPSQPTSGMVTCSCVGQGGFLPPVCQRRRGLSP